MACNPGLRARQLAIACPRAGMWVPHSSCRHTALQQRCPGARRAIQLPRNGRQFRRSLARAAVDPDNASILVCGGGGVALLTTSKLKDYGCWVWIMQRGGSRRAEIEQMGAILLKADALDKEAVQKAFNSVDEIDAVISTIGGTPANPATDSEGNNNLIDAAVSKGVKKFVLLTSIGTGDSKDAPPKQVYDILKPVLLEKEKAEAHLMGLQDKMTFTIIRPGGLKSEPATGAGVLTADASVCGAIHREDVAELLVKAVFSSATDNKVLSAVDSNQLYGEPKFEVFKL